MEMGAVMSFARTTSTFAFISSPGATSFLPQWKARIFSVIVIGILDNSYFLIVGADNRVSALCYTRKRKADTQLGPYSSVGKAKC